MQSFRTSRTATTNTTIAASNASMLTSMPPTENAAVGGKAFGTTGAARGTTAVKRAALGDLSNAKLKVAAKKSTAGVFQGTSALTGVPANARATSKAVVAGNGRVATKGFGGSSTMAEDMALDAVGRVSDVIDLVDEDDDVEAKLAVAPYEDIDAYDDDDAQCVTEYVTEIFAYLRQKELAERINANYMSLQTDITPKMRAILIDWMVDVHVKFKLLSETMFLSVSIVDRFLSIKPISRHKLQLIGITSMLVAAKYEELFCPEVRDFVFICDNAYSKDEILATEIQILNALNFSLTPATPLHFLRRFSKAARSDSTTHTLSKYLAELTLPEYELLAFKPSTIAAASVYVARAMRQITPYWTPTLEHYTQLSVDGVRSCAIALNEALVRSSTTTLKATRRKFSSPKLMSVGRIAALPTLPF